MPWTNAGRRKAAAERKGKHLSKKTRMKISQALKGKKHPHKGHSQSAATRLKISRALKARFAARKRQHASGRRSLGNHSTAAARIHSGRKGNLQTNADILSYKLRRPILGQRRMSNKWVITHHVNKRRRRQRSRLAG